MATTTNIPLPAASRHTIGATSAVCPHCNSFLLPVPRRPVDWILGLFSPVRRYHCSATEEDPACTWEGTLGRQSVAEGHAFHRLFCSVQGVTIRVHRQIRELWNHVVCHNAARNGPRIDEPPITAFVDVSFEDMAQITLDAIGDAVLVVDPKGTVIYLNKVAETLTAWPGKMALGRPVEEVLFIVDGITRQRTTNPSQRAISEGRIVALALGSVLIRRDGTDMAIEDSAAPIHNCFGKIAGAVIVFHDARQSHFETQKMSHLAQHDFLTGLPNRVLLVERLSQAIGMAKRHRKQVALLFLDLDHFKEINDAFGHAVGDQLLRTVAADMAGCVRATDTVSRHGGDEFVILLSEVEERRDIAQIAEKLLAKLAAPRMIAGHQLQVTLSIGISVYPEDGIDTDTLMLNADTAMYSAKNAGRSNYQYCPPGVCWTEGCSTAGKPDPVIFQANSR
ncbi:diguanylate cyclase domain-containing protein [Parahaliea aestuarii]|nr:diguanylate cyclase [Parahaliea aestuarii]